MSDNAISVQALSKRYVIGHKTDLADGLRHRIEEAFRAPFRGRSQCTRDKRSFTEEFWALKDVSFDLQAGEVLGIIGRNGAGKSTLLKLLSRITEPTSGRIKLNGRIASLLEVGTGFHQELTGRENVFLNGAILGMSRAEIKSKFDEIVAFSEIERFLDTPVKRYSSGMYVRLAFAVAAHLDPEILIVDEVLAVGDTAFQQKCLERIRSISDSGRTVVFVSHQLVTVRLLCKRGLVLDKGAISYYGDSAGAINHYLGRHGNASATWERSPSSQSQAGLIFRSAAIRNGSGEAVTEIGCDEHFTIDLSIEAGRLYDNVQIAIRFTNQEGVVAFTTCNTDADRAFLPIPAGSQKFSVTIDAALLMPGRYSLKVAAHIPQEALLDLIDDELAFTVHDTGNHVNALKDNREGVVCPVFKWTTS